MRDEAFDQIHLITSSDSGKGVLRLRRFLRNKPKTSERNSSETCHHSADLWICALILYTQPYLEGYKWSESKTARADSWGKGFSLVLTELKGLQNNTDGTWLCRIVPTFCCNIHTQERPDSIFLLGAFQKILWPFFAFVSML